MTCTDLSNSLIFAETPCDCGGCGCDEEPLPVSSCGIRARHDSLENRAAIADALETACPADLALVEGAQIDVESEIRVSYNGAQKSTIDGGKSTLLATQSNRILFVVQSAKLELSRVTLNGGYSDFWGGCVALGANSSLVAVDVVLTHCISAVHGGALAAFEGSYLKIVDSEISNSMVRVFLHCSSPHPFFYSRLFVEEALLLQTILSSS